MRMSWVVSERVEPIKTFCLRSDKYLLNHFNEIPLTPAFSSLAHKMSWFTVSKAFCTSRKQAATTLPSFKAFVMQLIICKIACSVDLPFKKPNWLS